MTRSGRLGNPVWAWASSPLVAPLAVGALAVASLAYVAAVDPHEPGHYPTCPSLLLTGWYCPGCGSLRALNSVTRFDLGGVWDMNPALLVAGPWLVWRWVRWLLEASGRRVPLKPAPGWALYGLAGVVGLYWIARNLGPLAPLLAP